MTDNPVAYDAETDTLLVTLRPWPGTEGDIGRVGGTDAGDDLVIHYAPDGEPWAWEIEHASTHPELLAEALAAVRWAVADSHAAA